MKWKTIAGWAAAIIAVLILVSFAALKIFVSPETVAMLVIPRLELVFERDVSYQAVDLSYFPNLGVRLSGIEIENARGFDERPLARVSHIDANIGFFSLLSGDPQIDKLVVSGWEMMLQVDSLGRRNFAELSADTIGVPDSVMMRAVDGEPLCNEFHLDGGRLLYRNDSTNVRLVLAGIDLTYSLSGNRAEHFEGELRVDSLLSRSSVADLRLTENAGEASFEGTYLNEVDSLAIRKCNWRFDAFEGRLDGRASRLHSLPVFSFHILSERTVLSEATNSKVLGLIPAFDRLGAKGNLRMELTFADSVADTLPPLVRGEMNLTDFLFTLPGSDIAAQIRFAEANFNHQTLSLYTEGAAIGRSPALLRFTVNNFSDPTYSGEINVVGEAEILLGVFGLDEHVQVDGFIEAALSGFIRPTDIEAGRIFGTLLIEGLSYRDTLNEIGIDDFNLESRFVGNSVDLPRFNLSVGENVLTLTGDIAEFPLAFTSGTGSLRRPKLDFRLASQKFDFDTLTTINAIRMLGESDTSNVWGLIDRMLEFNASGEVAIDSGRFWGVDFTDLGGRLSVVDRIVYSDSAHVRAFGGRLEGEIVMEFESLFEPELEIDFRGRDIEAADFLSYYTGLGTVVSGKVDLNCSITGRGLGGATLAKSLAMRGSFTMENGYVQGLPIANSFYSELGIEPFYGNRVTAVVGEIMLANETVRLNRLAFDSGPIEYSITGKLNLPDEVALNIQRSLERNEINVLSRLPDARSLMPRNPRIGNFLITGTEEEGYRIVIDSFR